ncbi:MAG: Glycogen synthase [Syntrophus sp. SKADARSKE-3]|nr:Glycogen synthase [Syntrophus sp. SKADARSKE-3]
MRILMFGWEFPPHISGGLGTACDGMTRALTGMGYDILFVMPHPGQEVTETDSPVRVLSTATIPLMDSPYEGSLAGRIDFASIVSSLRPYINGSLSVRRDPYPPDSFLAVSGGYGENLMAEVYRYSRAGAVIAARENFDVIHGHDWMAVPAGLAAREASGKPFVLHIHALEFDRNGDHIDQVIYDVEKRGMEAADAVIAVSHYTKEMIVNRYGIPSHKITVIHNAVTRREGVAAHRAERNADEKVVLFLGRITVQKGPEYFVEAARRVLQEMPDVTFVMAGAGDMMPQIVEKVAELEIGKRFHFTGFLRGDEVERMFARSDLYVMPSVSEPFGISPLEAMMYDVPVIISKQSGVSEVLHHALTVDFWDVDELANKMIAILKYPPLAGEMVRQAREELRSILWEKAAVKIAAVYQHVLALEGG